MKDQQKHYPKLQKSLREAALFCILIWAIAAASRMQLKSSRILSTVKQVHCYAALQIKNTPMSYKVMLCVVDDSFHSNCFHWLKLRFYFFSSRYFYCNSLQQVRET